MDGNAEFQGDSSFEWMPHASQVMVEALLLQVE
jgi:hypothetical protein